MALSRRYLTLLVLGIFTALAPLARAQAPAEAPPSFRIVSLGAAEPLLYDLDRKTTRTVYLTTTTYTRPQLLPADGHLRFYRMGVSADPKLPPPRIPVAEIQIPASAPKPVIIILIPGGLPGRPVPTLENGLPAEFSSLILDDSEKASPRDHLRVISFSKRPVGVKLGDAAVQLKPFETQLIPYPVAKRTSLLVATFSTETWVPIVSTVQMLAPDTRITLFFSDPPPVPGKPDPNDLLLRKIVEVLPALSPIAK